MKKIIATINIADTKRTIKNDQDQDYTIEVLKYFLDLG